MTTAVTRCRTCSRRISASRVNRNCAARAARESAWLASVRAALRPLPPAAVVYAALIRARAAA